MICFTAVSPSGKLQKLADFPAPEWKRDQFSYLVKEAFVTPKLDEEGMWKFRFALSSAPASTQMKEIWVTEPPSMKRTRAVQVAVSGVTPGLRKQLDAIATDVVNFQCDVSIQAPRTDDYPWLATLLTKRVKKLDSEFDLKLERQILRNIPAQMVLSPRKP